jgi:two-component system sensor histidine kinase KdpD
MAEDFDDHVAIDEDVGQGVGEADFDAAIVVRALSDGALDAFRDGIVADLELDIAGVEAGHLGGLFDETVEAVALFVDEGGLGEERGDGGLDGGEWCAEIVGDGVEECGAEALALVGGVGAGQFFDGGGTLDGDGDEAAHGLEGLLGWEVAFDGDGAYGTDADGEWKECGAGAVGLVGCGAIGGVAQLLVGDENVFGVGEVDAIAGEEIERRALGAEGGDDVLGNGLEEVGGGFGGEETLAEVVEELEFAAAAVGGGGLGLDAVGEVGADEGGDEEGEERDPVLRIGYGESADRREEEEVEAEGGGDGDDDGVAQAPGGGEKKHVEQQGEGDRRRIDVQDPGVERDDDGEQDACRQPAQGRTGYSRCHGTIVRMAMAPSNSAKTPEQWLEKVDPQQKERGRFKVFLGYAPGVGKTFSMMSEGIRRLARGEDVVIGIVETHGRPSTAELVEKLPAIPRRRLEYKGTLFEEMDIDAILQRHPEVVLVDELAHTNIEGSRHAKRYEDVMELLDAKIDVLVTVNIQHIESLTPQVQSLTGITVRETVPDWVLDRADEIVLADLTPEALETRMKRGDIYPTDRAERALSNFFRRGNLIALREMALQQVTRAVDRTLDAYVTRKRLGGEWCVREKVAVCMSASPNARQLIARGARLVEGLGAEFLVIYVDRGDELTEERKRSLEANIHFAENLGARVVTLHNRSVARATSEYVSRERITQVIFGRSAVKGLKTYLYYFAIQRFMTGAPHADLHIVTQEHR